MSDTRIRALYRVFGPFLKPYRGRILVAYAALGASVLMTLARPWPLKLILDSVLLKKMEISAALPILPSSVDSWSPYLLVTLLSISLVVVVLFESVFGYFQKVLFSEVGQSATTDVLEYAFTHLQSMPARDLTATSGDTLVRLTSDVKTLRDLLVNHLQKLGSYGLTFLSTVAVMLWMNWQLTLAGLAAVPFIWFASYRFSRGIREATKLKRTKEGEVASIVHEALQSRPVVQAFTQEDAERERFRREARGSLDASIESVRLGGAFTRSIKVLNTIGTALVIWLGATKVLQGSLTPGDLVVFAAYINELYTPIQNVSELAVQFMESLVSGERVLDLVQSAPKVRDAPHALRAPAFKGHVRFENVTFGYEEGSPVLKDFSFEVQPGEMVALVGASGSGKSTILNLVLRFFDPWQGRVTIDGEDIRRYKVRSFRSQISIMLQEPILFSRSVRANIAYGKPHASFQEIVAAAQAAHAHEFIQELPDGYDTVLDERGANLSGGQRQRLALARAFLRNAPILLLDEPTTGLDARTEAHLTATLERLTKGRTTIVVAHRLSTIERADRIVVLDAGRIVEQGPHQELLNKGGRYSELYRSQISDTVTQHRTS